MLRAIRPSLGRGRKLAGSAARTCTAGTVARRGAARPSRATKMTGRVVRLRAHVSTDAAGAPLHEGDRVVYSYFYPCRRCDFCRAGDAHHCVARRIGAGRAAKRREAPLHRCLRRLQLPPARPLRAPHAGCARRFPRPDRRALAARPSLRRRPRRER
ncbi:MAG: hypothetical protein DME12_15430 [Candidatus Rokuibacteriota bacterium]|nr:MAG: hypothetical protein DME12_15430 [Candidatus Rokubacteria bacterium]PYN64653.1 MAG: hypothetical protein DMD93_22360 [Candidatus Rokubacteria bacterium]